MYCVGTTEGNPLHEAMDIEDMGIDPHEPYFNNLKTEYSFAFELKMSWWQRRKFKRLCKKLCKKQKRNEDKNA